jgi:hypothetical protein
MPARDGNTSITLLVATVTLSLLISACTPRQVPQQTSTVSAVTAPATVSPTETGAPASTESSAPTPIPLPAITLHPSDFYFSVDGKESFIFSRNIAGSEPAQYTTFLAWTKAGGSKFARIQLDSLGGMGYTSTGALDESWAANWDGIFDQAQADGIYILPVFSGWFDWNDGPGYSTWKSNPLNQDDGGPVKSPAELFQKESATQSMWIQWMETLVKRWQGRNNILAWEIFSEVNLASGSTESAGIDFVNSAAAAIRAADAVHRPVTASLAEVGNWPDFYRKTSIDFINIHPYPPSAQLDRNIIKGVRDDLATYGRPVLIGESGLNAESPEKYPPGAEMGVRHAIWAAIVSGAMNGRSLYWEDSFGIYFPTLGLPFVQKYETEELAAANFVDGVDFSGFQPLRSTTSSAVWGAAIGNEKMVLGWYRDAASEPPDWKLQPATLKQKITLTVPGSAANWKVDFYGTRTGTDIVGSATALRTGGNVTITLPDLTDDIAFKMYVQ